MSCLILFRSLIWFQKIKIKNQIFPQWAAILIFRYLQTQIRRNFLHKSDVRFTKEKTEVSIQRQAQHWARNRKKVNKATTKRQETLHLIRGVNLMAREKGTVLIS